MLKNPSAIAGDTRDAGLLPGLGRCPGEGSGNPLQYSCLQKFHVQSSMEGYSPSGLKEQTRLSVHALVTYSSCLLSEM